MNATSPLPVPTWRDELEHEYAALRARIEHLVPCMEWSLHLPWIEAINRLKQQRGAVIMAHSYQSPEIFHGVADVTGDSLALAQAAADCDSDLIVLCGVHFMAESAKILAPAKTVLIPDLEAGCSLAASITAEDVRALRRAHPGVPVVSYVNTSAAVKAETDVCCTSANAVQVVESLGVEKVIFLPDQFLGKHVAKHTGVELVLWHGRCEVHEKFTPRDIRDIRAQFPDVAILAHPECSPEVTALADFSGGTNAMIRYVQQTHAPRYLVLTECAMGDNIAAANPDKELLRLCSVRCPHMNEITLEDTLAALTHHRYVIEVPEDIRVRAARALERMIAIG